MKKVFIINGPNLNMLGKREQEIYGNITLNELEKICADEAKKLDFNIYFCDKFLSIKGGKYVRIISITKYNNT